MLATSVSRYRRLYRGRGVSTFRVDLNRENTKGLTPLTYSDSSRGGRPSCDPVIRFKIPAIQSQNNLSDERAEFPINDQRDRIGPEPPFWA